MATAMTDRAATAAAPYPPAGRAWYVVGLLTTAYVISFVDRQILSLLVQPIRASLGLTDFEMSWIGGPAFALCFSFLGLPFGYLADRTRRRTLVAFGIAVWCVMTAACGLAQDATQLFLARMGVGVGEAVLAPCALSMISDLFPRDRLAKPIGVYTMGISMGSGIAFALGGAAIAWIEHARESYAAIAHLEPWRGAFFLIGLPGLVLVPLFLMLREPERRERIAATAGASTAAGANTGAGMSTGTGAGASKNTAPSLGDTVRFIATRWRSYVPLFAGKAVFNILAYAHFWLPTMFQRTWGWKVGEIGPAYGAVVLVAGLLGVNFGGWIADHWYQRGRHDASLHAMIVALSLIVVFHTAAPLMPNGGLALALLFPSLIGSAIGSATGSSATMLVTPNEYRGQVASLSLLIAGGSGLFLGPTSVAFLTQFVLGGEQQLQYGLALTGLALLLLGRHAYREELARLEARLKAARESAAAP